jgi:hypothetical protein
VPSKQRWTFLSMEIIYNDLLKVQDTSVQEKIQHKNMYGYFCIISAKFEFMNFYTEILRK